MTRTNRALLVTVAITLVAVTGCNGNGHSEKASSVTPLPVVKTAPSCTVRVGAPVTEVAAHAGDTGCNVNGDGLELPTVMICADGHTLVSFGGDGGNFYGYVGSTWRHANGSSDPAYSKVFYGCQGK